MASTAVARWTACACLLSLAFAQEARPPPPRIEVLSGRALRDALRILEVHLDCTITYEDPPYDHPDAVAPHFPGGALVPRSRRLSIALQSLDSAPKQKCIESVVHLYHRQDPPVRFAVQPAKGAAGLFHVLPTRVRGADGQWANHAPVLSRPISLPETEDTYQGFVKRICAAVAKTADDARVSTWRPPAQAFARKRLTFAAENESARSCLDRLTVHYLGSQQPRITWHLVRDPDPKFRLLYVKRVLPGPPRPVSLHIVAERPLAEALAIIQRLFGRVITYEDPEYTCALDIMKNKAGVPQILHGDILSFAYDPQDGLAAVIAGCIEAHHQQSWHGAFALTRRGGVFHVLPIAAREALSVWAPRASALEVTLPVAIESASPRGALTQFALKLAERLGKPVALTEFPELRAGRKTLTCRTDLRTARDVLTILTTQIATITSKKTSWQFLYDPRTRGYTLRVCHIPSP